MRLSRDANLLGDSGQSHEVSRGHTHDIPDPENLLGDPGQSRRRIAILLGELQNLMRFRGDIS